MLRAIAALLVLMACIQCGGNPATTPIGPSATPIASSATDGRISVGTGPRIEGTVLETSREGTFPVAGSTVVFIREQASGSVTADGAGRYSIPNLANQERVRVVAFAPPERPLFQRSAVSAVVNGNTRVDVELVAEPVLGLLFDSPSLSGSVYITTPDGPRPQAHTRVFYKSFDGPWYDVYQSTDEQGRFAFGRLPVGPGRLGVGNCNDQALIVPVDVQGDTVANVDITAFAATCPGAFF